MFLSDQAILEKISAGTITIDPFNARALKPASYVLTLGTRFRQWRGKGVIDLWGSQIGEDQLGEVIEDSAFLVRPRDFALAQTVERVGLCEQLAAAISPLSHVARFGLGINGGADWVNPGFGAAAPSYLTLELYNYSNRPLLLRAGMPICHLRLAEVAGAVSSEGSRWSVYEGSDPLGVPQLRAELGSHFGKQTRIIDVHRVNSNLRSLSDCWPPHCCVAAFVAAALQNYGLRSVGRPEIARRIGVRVGINDENPFQLSTTEQSDQTGLAPAYAAVTINKMLAECNTGLAFRHVRFDQIALDGEQQVLEEALRRSVVVGVGVDYSLIESNHPLSQRHLFRVCGMEGEQVCLVDDSRGSRLENVILQWDQLEAATKSIGDGWWMIGRTDQLSFSRTLPWPAR